MNSIATNRAAIRVQYHGIKNSEIENEAYYTPCQWSARVINASDDAAGLFIAGRMKAQISGLRARCKKYI